ncbi:hypothetical protein [Marinivivus vitaminiproducens]|uniref:hypothetical protein n=1 Tax=Marinivivus vitaminiproducens TaxID=3035935 RepID=UPI0027A5E7D6|nr:hypothetical protein P4R82_16085 [Geminicoccaceae bacterium SCSIO 64248]
MRRNLHGLLGLAALAALGVGATTGATAQDAAAGRETVRTARGDVFVYRGEVERRPQRGASPGGYGERRGERDAWYYNPGISGAPGFYGYGGGYYDGGAYGGRDRFRGDRRGYGHGYGRPDRSFAPSIVPRFMEPPRRGPWVGVPARARVPFDRRSFSRWR